MSIETIQLAPQRKDFNDDLIGDGLDVLAAQITDQLNAEDRMRFVTGSRGG